MKVEYCTLKPDISVKGWNLLEEMNKLGRERWKFIFIESGLYYFMREVKK